MDYFDPFHFYINVYTSYITEVGKLVQCKSHLQTTKNTSEPLKPVCRSC